MKRRKWLLELLGEYLPRTEAVDEPYINLSCGVVSIIMGSYLDVANTVKEDSTTFILLEKGMELMLKDMAGRLANTVSPRFSWRKVWNSLPRFSGKGLDRFYKAADDSIYADTQLRYRVYAKYAVTVDTQQGIYFVQPCYEFGIYSIPINLLPFTIPMLSSSDYAREIIKRELSWGY